jgi:hypothetical protein
MIVTRRRRWELSGKAERGQQMNRAFEWKELERGRVVPAQPKEASSIDKRLDLDLISEARPQQTKAERRRNTKSCFIFSGCFIHSLDLRRFVVILNFPKK